VILRANSILKDHLNSASTVAMGANSTVIGNVEAATTVALGADATITGKNGIKALKYSNGC
jgi:serine acetyltransferase